MKSVYYFDSRGREILHVPFVFVVINSARKGIEVILEPNRLKRRLNGLKRSKISLERGLIGYPEISQEDIDTILELCSQNEIKEAKSYCIDIFDYVYYKVYETENFDADSFNDYNLDDYNPSSDISGYDSRFIPDFGGSEK